MNTIYTMHDLNSRPSRWTPRTTRGRFNGCSYKEGFSGSYLEVTVDNIKYVAWKDDVRTLYAACKRLKKGDVVDLKYLSAAHSKYPCAKQISLYSKTTDPDNFEQDISAL